MSASTAPKNAKPNRLAAQTSPYLLQHRFNPVEWFAWGDEAFAEARRRDVPIFLSVGYSTCYWCHVMERESFESESIAAVMNERFVCIKVDREERPDVDDIYMAAVQAFTQHGGWPMSVFLEPGSLEPFWAGTYFPAEPRAGMNIPAFPQVLVGLSEAWKTRRDEIEKQAEELADAVRERVVNAGAPVRVGEEQVSRAVAQLIRMHDPVHGGFGGAGGPKFPQPVFLDLLLAARQAAGDDDTRQAIDHALRTTLTRMALGGMFDQVGGGFHRYSVDQQWLVPHFEKMLYDNGALMEVYARAFAQYGDPLHARVARRIGEYVLREMTAPNGGFHSAQDAEVNHREGQNYLWTREQMRSVLGTADGEWAARLYGVEQGPNFRDPHHPEEAASNVLFVSERVLADVGANPWEDEAFVRRVDEVNARLYAARAKRDQPGTDTKVLTGWNGLMIAGLARAGQVLNEPRFLAAAERAAGFVLGSMRDADGGLLRTYSPESGRAAIDGFLEDYALVVHGLLELHQAGADQNGRFLAAAREGVEHAEKRFGDGRGAFFDTLADRPDLFVRPRSVYDGAIPSGSSVMINNYVDLAMITRERVYAQKAARAIAGVSAYLAQTPLGAANATRGLLRLMFLDRAALDKAFGDAPNAAVEAEVHADEPIPVEILSAVESVTIPKGQPIGIVLRVRIEPGYHVNAAIPGDESLVPFKVHVVHGSGVAVYADYPAGEAYGTTGEIRVYRGEFELPIVLERSGEWKGSPVIAVTYQACTETECLTARTVELDVEIERE